MATIKAKIDAIIAGDKGISVELTDGRKLNGFALATDTDNFDIGTSPTDPTPQTIPFSAIVIFRPVDVA